MGGAVATGPVNADFTSGTTVDVGPVAEGLAEVGGPLRGAGGVGVAWGEVEKATADQSPRAAFAWSTSW